MYTGKKDRVFLVSMINIIFGYEPTGNTVICLQILGTSRVNLSFHFINSGNARKCLPEFTHK